DRIGLAPEDRTAGSAIQMTREAKCARAGYGIGRSTLRNAGSAAVVDAPAPIPELARLSPERTVAVRPAAPIALDRSGAAVRERACNGCAAGAATTIGPIEVAGLTSGRLVSIQRAADRAAATAPCDEVAHSPERRIDAIPFSRALVGHPARRTSPASNT